LLAKLISGGRPENPAVWRDHAGFQLAQPVLAVDQRNRRCKYRFLPFADNLI